VWCGQEELAAETSPGNQHLTSEEGSPDASLATTETATTWQKSGLVDSAATCDVADRFGNKNPGLYRELDETRDFFCRRQAMRSGRQTPKQASQATLESVMLY